MSTVPQPTNAVAIRQPGRPRDARTDRLIHEATLDLFIEVGFDALSIERVAERAGVGKTTIYRRWPSKDALVLATIDTLYEGVEVPNTGDVRADLASVVGQMHDLIRKTKAGQALPRMVAEMAHGTPLGQAYTRTVMQPRLEGAIEAIERAKERGELRPDANVQLALASIVGPMMFLVLTGRIKSFGDELAERLVDQAIEGMRPRH